MRKIPHIPDKKENGGYFMVRRLQNWWQCLSRKHIVLSVFALTIGLAFGVSFFLGRSSKLNGMWKINPNAMPGYGMCLEIDGGSISASGDLVNYYGFMDFNYEIVNDHQLILTYDWNFGQGWPWNIAYAEEIPLEYSLEESGNKLTLRYAGTDFVFLDNTNHMDIYPSNGAVMNGGQVTFYKVKD